jgi:hypothetical protein
VCWVGGWYQIRKRKRNGVRGLKKGKKKDMLGLIQMIPRINTGIINA